METPGLEESFAELGLPASALVGEKQSFGAQGSEDIGGLEMKGCRLWGL